MTKVRCHLFATGRVQGVFFRMKTQREATQRNITGWVRNRADGRVEAVFEGEKGDVEALIEFCKKGPPGAIVTRVDVQWESYSGEFKDFRVRYRYSSLI